MKVIACSCSHFDLMIGSYDAHDDIVKAMRCIIDATHGADLFVHCGDVFNTNHPSPRAYATIIELLNQVGCETILIPGNHDPDALEPLKKIEFPQKVRVVDVPQVVPVDDKYIMFIPHISDVKARKMSQGFLAQATVDWMFEQARYAHMHDIEGDWRVNCVFAHLNVEGAVTSTDHVMRGQELALPVKVARELPAPVICGHIHKAQKLEPNIYVVGSVVPTNFGEKNDDKKYLEIEI